MQTFDKALHDMQGRPVDRATLAKLQDKSTPVLVCEFIRRVDPQYLVLYKPGTLVVYLRPDRPRPPQPATTAAPVGPPPVPVPIPARQPTGP